MTKLKAPLISLAAHGTLADSITYQKRPLGQFVRKKPVPSNPKTLSQMYQRWLFLDYAYLWRQLDTATKQQWESDARRRRISGFNLWQSTHLQTMPDTIARWHLDERAGNTAIDFSKNANHFTLHDILPVPGLVDYACYFNGDFSYMQAPDAPSLNPTKALTILTTFKPEASTMDTAYLFLKGTVLNLSSRSDSLYKFAFFISIAGEPEPPLEWNYEAVGVDKWFRLAFVYDSASPSNNQRLFVNGELKAAQTRVGDIDVTSQPLYAGLPFSNHKGIIDEVIFYNRALDNNEIITYGKREYPVP